MDQAESEPGVCRAVNAVAVQHLAEACRGLDCPLVQISTDYVFGGAADPPRPHREDDPTSPQGVYAADQARRRAGGGQVPQAPHRADLRPVRPAVAPGGARTSSRRSCASPARTDKLRVVADQHCTPSYVPHVARALLFLAGVDRAGPAPWGIYHVTNRGATTWHELAGEIVRLAGLRVTVEPITTAEYPRAAPRPAYSVLDTAAYHRLGGPVMPDWKAAIAEYFAETK